MLRDYNWLLIACPECMKISRWGHIFFERGIGAVHSQKEALSSMSEAGNSPVSQAGSGDNRHEGRDDYEMDIDRMVNEGLGGGQVTHNNGLVDDTTTDTMGNGGEEDLVQGT